MRSVLIRAIAILVSSLALCAGSARATPIEYVFTPDASITVGGDAEAISGYFFFDAITGQQSNVNFTLTGAGPYAGLYQNFAAQANTGQGGNIGIDAYSGGCNSGGYIVPGCGSGGDLVNFYFPALTVGSVDLFVAVPPTVAYNYQYPLNDSFWCGLAPYTSCNPVDPATAVAGGVDAVPEAATWTMMLAGLLSLAGFALHRRRKQSGADLAA